MDEVNDLVERLRGEIPEGFIVNIMLEAANRIEQLESGLKGVMKHQESMLSGSYRLSGNWNIANNALNKL